MIFAFHWLTGLVQNLSLYCWRWIDSKYYTMLIDDSLDCNFSC